MRKNWVSLAGFLALAVGQTGILTYGDDAAATTPASDAEIAPTPLGITNNGEPTPAASTAEVSESDAHGFWAVNSNGHIGNATRVSVRVVRSGRIVQSPKVGLGGVAQIARVAPGLYSIMASGPDGFAAYGAYLSDPAGPAVSRIGLIPQRDDKVVRQLIRSHTNAESSSVSTVSASKSDEVMREWPHSNGAFTVQSDGSIKGQIIRAAPDGEKIQPLANEYIAFVRDGLVARDETTDADGNFVVSGMTAGIYSVVIAGPDGFAAFSTEVVQANAVTQGRVSRFQLVAFQPPANPGAINPGSITPISPASNEDMNQLNQDSQLSSESGNPGMGGMGGGPGLGGGPGAGGGAGGGAAGGGLGGGGGLLGAALGAAGGALAGALSNNNNNPPATPAGP